MTTPWDFIGRRSKAYKQTFGEGDHGSVKIVLKDLAKFCRANGTCFDPDPRVHAALEGRREVWQRIANHLNLSQKELLEIYHPGQPIDIGDDK